MDTDRGRPVRGRLCSAGTPTTAWLERAADDPLARHPTRLPETLDFSPWAEVMLRTFHSAPPETELGCALAVRDGALRFSEELSSRARQEAYLPDGARLVGSFHVHPAGRAAFFDPQDLAAALRSDNPGFVDLLLARDRLFALVRANPYLYISAHHVNRNPLLLAEEHAARVKRLAPRGEEEREYDAQYRRAGLYWFQRYQLALYEGDPQAPLSRTVTPEARWR